MNDFRQIFLDGLWRNNPGLTALLGICPLLAVSNTLIKGLGLGIATMLVLLATSTLVSLTRRWLSFEVRLPVFVLIIASLVTVVALLLEAFFYELYLSLGIFVPLIVTNCLILGRAEVFASRRAWLPSIADGLAQGAGFTLVLVVLGGLREIIGRGSLLFGADMLFGSGAAALELTLVPGNNGLLLALLPPGAFMSLALLVALKNHLTGLQSARQTTKALLQAETEAAG
jgi:electron transport complex protein RnfE